MSALRLIVLLIASVVATGCTRHPPPALATSPAVWPAAWGDVLEAHVDDAGRVDFAGVAADPETLAQVVAGIAADPPDTGATEAERLARHVNAYNALAMYNVIVSGRAPSDKVGFFVLQQFDTGHGRYASLYDYENDVIRPFGESRVHFVLNCMVVSCPRLRREPIEATTLETVLVEAAREFLEDPRNVVVDHERRVVRVSKILTWYRADYEADAPSLIAYLNRYRTEPIPEGYAVRELPYDWSLNDRGTFGR